MIKKKKQKKINVKEEFKDWKFGIKYLVFADVPEDLIPTEKNIGNIVEVAGFKPREFFKLVAWDTHLQHATVINENGATRSLEFDRVMLHRNENTRLHGELGFRDKMKKMKRSRRSK